VKEVLRLCASQQFLIHVLVRFFLAGVLVSMGGSRHRPASPPTRQSEPLETPFTKRKACQIRTCAFRLFLVAASASQESHDGFVASLRELLVILFKKQRAGQPQHTSLRLSCTINASP
jgi:hypothetical protein